MYDEITSALVLPAVLTQTIYSEPHRQGLLVTLNSQKAAQQQERHPFLGVVDKYVKYTPLKSLL